MVEPTDGADVESGELRWPPDEPGSPDAQTKRQSAEGQTAGEREVTENNHHANNQKQHPCLYTHERSFPVTTSC